MKVMSKLAWAAAFLVLTAGIALPQGLGHGRRAGREVRKEVKDLNLTPEQKQQWKSIRQKHKGSTEGLRHDLAEIDKKIDAARKNNDNAAVESLTRDRANMTARLADEARGLRNELRSVLNPDQQAKFDQMIDKRKANRKRATA